MTHAVIWDVEFLTDADAPQRFWCGPTDPDPVLVQIGAVELRLTGACDLGARFSQIVIPRTRDGDRWPLPDLFTRLTGITEDRVTGEGVELAEALADFDRFTAGVPVWAWGNDELFAVAISCYLAGLAPPLAATRFGNATRLLARAGEPIEAIHGLRSDRLAAHFGLATEALRAHDALGDALSTALALQHLLRSGRLAAADFAHDRRAGA
ncbi:MAG: exonuclease [Maritimibacter sp.]|nr:exonuclease [Maritimibacter sp.]